jgi:hypothetical protein
MIKKPSTSSAFGEFGGCHASKIIAKVIFAHKKSEPSMARLKIERNFLIKLSGFPLPAYARTSFAGMTMRHFFIYLL